MIQLGTLTPDETVEQLRLLRPDTSREAAAAIHARSGGQPLFTEQLAQADAGEPTFLNDLLDGRVARLSGDDWRAASVLGVADRPLTEYAITLASGLDRGRLDITLWQLREQRLLDVADATVHLRHPLLAEAVRRRLLPAERGDVHRALAEVLSTDPAAEPAEVAAHWQGASDRGKELVWRIRAARAASDRFAGSQAADHWLRALALWPEGTASLVDPTLRRHELVAGVSTQLDLAARPLEAVSVLEAALGTSGYYDDSERADQLRLLARFSSTMFTSDRNGLALADEAIALYRTLPSTPGLAAALNWKGIELEWHGRRDEASAVLAEAATRGRRAGRHVARAFCARRAGLAARRLGRRGRCRGDRGRHLRVPLRAQSADGPGRGRASHRHPAHDLPIRRNRRGRRSPGVGARRSVALPRRPRPGPQEQRRPGLATIRSGEASHAGPGPETEGEEPGSLSFLHTERALLEVLCGNEQAGAKPSVPSGDGPAPGHRPVRGRGPAALRRLDGRPRGRIREVRRAARLSYRRVATRHRRRSPGTGRPRSRRHVGPIFARRSPERRNGSAGLARSAAPRPFRSPSRTRRPGHCAPVGGGACPRTWGGHRRWMAGRSPELGPRGPPPRRGVLPLARGAGRPARGQGTVAARLLKKAALDAREHVPLSQAIAATAAGAR